MALQAAWCLALVLVSVQRTFDGVPVPMLADDAMISMRYATNLVHGHGLVWNPGERVEGFSNPLQVVLMALAQLAFGSKGAVLAVQAFGVGTLFLTTVATAVLARRLAPRLGDLAVLVGTVAGAAFVPLSFWSVMGMETGIMALLLVGALLALLELETHPNLARPGLVLALAGLVLVRPEGLPVSLLLGGLAWWRSRGDARASKAVLVALVASAGVALAVLVARLAYYGELAPNTYHLKVVGIPLRARLANGWAMLEPQLRLLWPMVVPLLFVPRGTGRVRPADGLAAWAVFVALQTWMGGDAFWGWRILAPAMPLLLLAALLGVVQVTEGIRDWVRPHLAGLRAGPLGAALAVAFVLMPGTQASAALDTQDPAWIGWQWQNDRADEAQVLAQVLGPDASIAVASAGIIPYYVDARALDILGKADAHVARVEPHVDGPPGNGLPYMPAHNRFDLAYSIVQLSPTFTEITAWHTDDQTAWVQAHYDQRCIAGRTFWLWTNSTDVDWERVGELESRYPC